MKTIEFDNSNHQRAFYIEVNVGRDVTEVMRGKRAWFADEKDKGGEFCLFVCRCRGSSRFVSENTGTRDCLENVANSSVAQRRV